MDEEEEAVTWENRREGRRRTKWVLSFLCFFAITALPATPPALTASLPAACHTHSLSAAPATHCCCLSTAPRLYQRAAHILRACTSRPPPFFPATHLFTTHAHVSLAVGVALSSLFLVDVEGRRTGVTVACPCRGRNGAWAGW